MGLCKCPKKKVTNLFCFEHRVNVCETCLVEGHPKCVVQSYLQWLQDSDYNPNCSLCNRSLQEEDCIRLCCYDVFHWRCLNDRMQKLPSNTAPAGYECPLCSKCVIPAENAAGPVVDGVRSYLRQASWAQTALGIAPAAMAMPDASAPLAAASSSAASVASAALSQRAQSDSVELLSEQQQNSYNGGTSIITKKNAAHKFRAAPSPTARADVDENKYARRSAFTWLHWLLRSRSAAGNQRKQLSPRRRLLLLGFLIFLAAATLLYLMSTIGRQAAESDPMLKPEFNPNIRIEQAEPVV